LDSARYVKFYLSGKPDMGKNNLPHLQKSKFETGNLFFHSPLDVRLFLRNIQVTSRFSILRYLSDLKLSLPPPPKTAMGQTFSWPSLHARRESSVWALIKRRSNQEDKVIVIEMMLKKSTG